MDRCLRESLSARIAKRTTVAAVKCRCVRGHTASVIDPTRCHTWKRVGKTLGPCVAVLCVDVDTDDRTAFILQKTSLLQEKCRVKCRVKPRGRESENVQNRNKTMFLVTVFNL